MRASIEKAAKKILEAKEIAITSHINPDGDSIGSLLALGLGLEKLGKKVYMLSPDGVPKRYAFLKGSGHVIRKIDKPLDLAIGVDCSNSEILGESAKSFALAKDILEIDHHQFRRTFGNLQMIDYKAAAVGELIFMLLNKLKVHIDEAIAQSLLTSIIVETGSFRLPNIRPFTFKVCSELIRSGADYYKLVDSVFWARTRESVVLSGICLSRCKFVKNSQLAWSIVRKRDFDLVKGTDEDVDTVADEIRAIQQVKIVILFREKNNNELRVSLRSKGKVNVSSIAEHYNGGGHFDVAGCYIPNKMHAIKKLLGLAKKLLP